MLKMQELHFFKPKFKPQNKNKIEIRKTNSSRKNERSHLLHISELISKLLAASFRIQMFFFPQKYEVVLPQDDFMRLCVNNLGKMSV